MRKLFKDIAIEQDFIAVFGSGKSINEISPEEVEEIKQHSFLITMNYAPIKVKGHLNMWSDKKVTAFLDDHYRENEKDMLFLARDKSMRSNRVALYHKVDFWFNERQERIMGNYTIVWLLQLLEKYFPKKKVLIFGMDMTAGDQRYAKWYDNHTDYDYRKRGNHDVDRKLKVCAGQLDRYLKRPEMFVNCNPNSAYTRFEKREWREVVQ